MKVFATLLTTIALASTAAACDSIAFSAGSCYQAAYVAPVQQQYYAPPQPVVSYYSQPQTVILPARVEYVRPELRLSIQQTYGYAQPALPVIQYQKSFQGYSLGVQKFRGHGYSLPVVNVQKFSAGNNTVVDVDRGLFGRTTITEADGDRKTFNFRGQRVR